MRLFTILFAATLACAAQDISFQGPISGWVEDPPTQSIRLITGMPGAAMLGRQLVSDVAWASTAPGSGSIAIALRNGEAAESVILRGEATSVIEGPSIAGVPQFVAWAPNASAAILFWADTREAQIIRIETDRAYAGDRFSIGNLPGGNLPKTGAITAAAALPDAFYFAVAGSGVYKAPLENGASADLLLTTVDCAVIAVHPAGGKLWAVDRSSNTLLELPSSGGDPVTLSSDPEVVSGLSALQVSTDRKFLYLANATSKRIYRLDFESRQIGGRVSELDAAATMMTPLSRPSIFLLGVRASNEEPLYVWDESSGNVFFVPNGGDSQ